MFQNLEKVEEDLESREKELSKEQTDKKDHEGEELQGPHQNSSLKTNSKFGIDQDLIEN